MMCITWLAAGAVDKSTRLPGDVLPWLILLIGLILIGGAVIYFVRRWLYQDSSSAHDVGFTLQDLRDLHTRGELTDEEFQLAKTRMIGRLSTPPAAPPKPKQTDPSTGNHEQSSE